MVAVTVAAAHTSQVWPTIERVLTVVAAAAANGAAWWGRRNHQINQRIEVSVNGQLYAKINELARTAEALRLMTIERDQARTHTTGTTAGTTPGAAA
jgi:hypothetical protein